MKEALKLALEALTNAIAVRNGEGGTKLVSPLEENAITAIKEALAPTSTQCEVQPEQEPSVTKTGCGILTLHSGFDDLPDGTKFYSTPPKQEPRNFCPRCGKRTADLTVIHTCTPPEGGHQ